jgi:hypothetical protein
MPAPKKEIEKEEEKKFEPQKNIEVPEEFKCLISSQGVHFFNLFLHNDSLVAICSRCLKVVTIKIPTNS